MFCVKRAMQLRNIQYFKLTSTICIIPKHQSTRLSQICILHTKVTFRDLRNINYQKICDFHTTSQLHIPPVIAVILRPILRLGALFLGRGIKRWWKKQPEEEKEKYKLLIRQNKDIFLGSFGILGLMLFIYYLTHIEIDPITKRKRFIIFSKREQAQLGKLMFEMHLEVHKASLVSQNHPAYKKLTRIIKNILIRNKDLISVNEEWTLTIVNSPLRNAYVLPERNIFVFLGALDIVENDDQLTFILAHEMAHSLLLHAVEQLSNAVLLDVLLTIPFLLIWACFPDLMAAFFHIFVQHIVTVLHNLPYSRALENEADDVGLKLAAKACADIREAVVFWGIMRTLSEINLEADPVPWLSTHPAHGDREQRINKKLPEAIELMKSSACPPLSRIDPRKKFYARTIRDHEIYFKQKGIIPAMRTIQNVT